MELLGFSKLCFTDTLTFMGKTLQLLKIVVMNISYIVLVDINFALCLYLIVFEFHVVQHILSDGESLVKQSEDAAYNKKVQILFLLYDFS